MAEENTPVEGEEEVVPDYSRVGFRALQALCKDRGLPGDGNSITLIERLKAWDAQHGKDVDLSAAENLAPAAEEDDPLGLDDPDESPVGDGEAASASSPTGAPTAGEDVIGVGTVQPSGVLPTELPGGGTVTSEAPAVVVYSSPDAPKGLPRASGHGGRADLTVKNGLVKVGEGHGAAEVRGFRHEIPIGTRPVTDDDHFAYIAETHAAANAAGYQTKGGATVGERVGYSQAADGARTAIYQVALKRVR